MRTRIGAVALPALLLLACIATRAVADTHPGIQNPAGSQPTSAQDRSGVALRKLLASGTEDALEEQMREQEKRQRQTADGEEDEGVRVADAEQEAAQAKEEEQMQGDDLDGGEQEELEKELETQEMQVRNDGSELHDPGVKGTSQQKQVRFCLHFTHKS